MEPKPYHPTSQHLVGRFSDTANGVTVAAVAALEPLSRSERSRLLFHVAFHVAWAEEQGTDMTTKALFAPQVVEHSISVATLPQSSLSPYAADLRRVARAALPRVKTEHRQKLEVDGRQAPYTKAEQTSLRAVASGMSKRDQASYLAGLALGLGAGLLGSPATQVEATDLIDRRGLLLVRRRDTDNVIPASPSWAALLRSRAAEQPHGPLTEIYTSAGRQRLALALKRATGCVAFDSFRMRTTWVVEHLSAGVPVDVLAASTAERPWTLAQHLTFVPEPSEALIAEWLSGERSVPTLGVPLDLFSGLSARPRGKRTTTPTHFDFDAFSPIDTMAKERWHAGLAEQTRALVTGLDGGRARNLVTALSSALTWAC